MRKFYLLALMALWAAVGQTQTITVKVNGTERTASSLENAIGSTTPSSITSLEVTGGYFTETDWNKIKSGIYTSLQRFVIESAVSVYQITSTGTSGSLFLNGNSNLRYINIANLQNVPQYFCAFHSLEEAVFPDALRIETGAFSTVSTAPLKIIRIPKATYLGVNAFQRCNLLELMEIGATPPAIESNTFALLSEDKKRELVFVNSNRQPLTGEDLKNAQLNYSKPANGGSENNGLVKWRNLWLVYPSYTVTYATDGQGSIVDAWGDPVTSYLVSQGHNAPTVTAQPDAGYVLNRWSDGTPVDEYKQHMAKNVQSDITVTAYFTLPSVQKKVTYSASTGGLVNGQSSVNFDVNVGDDGPEVTASPLYNYDFLRWSDFTIDNPHKVTNVQDNISIVAEFVNKNESFYELIYSAGANGHITGVTHQRIRTSETGQEVIAVANSGYKFVRWDDGNPNANRQDGGQSLTVTAEFATTGTSIHTLNYSVNGSGSISGYTRQNVAKGTDGVSVTVVPNTGHKFVRWSDGRIDNPRTDENVQENISVTAIVVPQNTKLFTLEYSVRDAGTGTLSGLTTQTVEQGGNGIQVRAIPAAGYVFLRWNDGSAENPRQDANVQTDISVQAIFVNSSSTIYNLKYSVKNAGSGNISGHSTQSVEPNGDGAPVEAIPADNYKFVRWSDNGNTNPKRQDKNVQTHITAAAIMIDVNTPTYTLNYNISGNGHINGLTTQTVEHGGNGLMVTAEPNTNHKFVRWSDGLTNPTRQDANVQNNINVTAIVVHNDVPTYTFTYTADANGNIDGPTPQIVEQGGDGIAVTAAPKANYIFLHWSDSTISNPRQDKNAQSDINVKAKFVSSSTDVHTLTYTASTGGSISGIAQQRVVKGGNGAKVTAIADAGYVFVSWSDGNPNAARWDTNVQDDINVTAEFVPEGTPIYTLTYSASENQNGTKRGYITGYATQKVAQGGCGAKVIAKPNTDFNFNGWDDGNTEDSRKDCNVQSDINVTAKFIGTFCDKPELRKDSIVKACHEFWWDATRHYTTSGHKVINMIDEYEWNTLYEEWCPLAVDLHLTLEHRDTAYFTATVSNSYTFHDTTITTPGSHVVDINIPNTRPGALCDSVVRIYLTIIKQNLTHAETANGVSNNIAIYPNPTSTGFYVETEATEVRISSINGYLHLQQPVNGKTYVDISHLPSGVYIVRAGNAAARVVKI